MNENRERSPIKIELPYGHFRNIVRVVKNKRWTGRIVTGWTGVKFWQWAGHISYQNKEIEVFGYQLYAGAEPDRWSNDTY